MPFDHLANQNWSCILIRPKETLNPLKEISRVENVYFKHRGKINSLTPKITRSQWNFQVIYTVENMWVMIGQNSRSRGFGASQIPQWRGFPIWSDGTHKIWQQWIVFHRIIFQTVQPVCCIWILGQAPISRIFSSLYGAPITKTDQCKKLELMV